MSEQILVEGKTKTDHVREVLLSMGDNPPKKWVDHVKTSLKDKNIEVDSGFIYQVKARLTKKKKAATTPSRRTSSSRQSTINNLNLNDIVAITDFAKQYGGIVAFKDIVGSIADVVAAI